MVAGRGRLPVQDAVSAGGVVWRRGEKRVEIVVCGRRADRSWMLPKGTPDAGESLEETAMREVREETGLEVELGATLPTIEYWFTMNGVRYHKRVHHWLMQPTGGDVANHDHEFDDVVWMPVDEALRKVNYSNQRQVIAEAAKTLDALV